MRHQLARLIQYFGGEVVFFQKPAFFWENLRAWDDVSASDGVKLSRTKQLIHHQLRIFDFLGWVNAEFEERSIREKIGDYLDERVVVVNFNYDYFFLRKLFPKNKIVTIINDDFVAQARVGVSHVEKTLSETCKSSDVVLTVSYPLVRKLSRWCAPVLFLPWADAPYSPPDSSGKRDAVLIWASINNILDFELLAELAKKSPDTEFFLVGPMSRRARRMVENLISRNLNVFYFSARPLESLPLERFFAGFMPYKSGVASTEAVTLANKSLRLMSKGLPLIVHGMPHFFKHEAIFSCTNSEQILERFEQCKRDFLRLQKDIEILVSENSPESRHGLFVNTLNAVERKM